MPIKSRVVTDSCAEPHFVPLPIRALGGWERLLLRLLDAVIQPVDNTVYTFGIAFHERIGMDTSKLLAELRIELGRVNQAIAAIESLDGGSASKTGTVKVANVPQRRRRISAASRRKMAAAQKARWAKQKQAAKA